MGKRFKILGGKWFVEQHTTLLASEKDLRLLFDVQKNPPGPNGDLRRAAGRYKQLIESLNSEGSNY